VVAAANYLRFGPKGVRLFGPGSSGTSLTHPRTLTLSLSLKDAAGAVIHEWQQITAHHSTPDKPFDLEGTTTWHYTSDHVQLTWVWDLYRLYGGIRLASRIAADNKTITDALQKLEPGTKIVATVESQSGNILQVYPIDRPPFEQESEA
jgi:hypothetical protein